MKLIVFVATVAAAVGQPAQSSFDHGHKIGSGIAYLAESANPQASQAAEILANLDLHFAEVSGKSKGTGVPGVPCAVFETWVETGAAQATTDFADSAGTGVTRVERTEGKAVIYRFLLDNVRQVYVSYMVTMEALSGGTYRLSFSPSTDEPPAQVRGKADWKVLAPAKFPVPQIVKDEDSVRLELYSNGISWRLIEYVHAGAQDRMNLRMETPHASYAEDAELTITAPRLRVNGIAEGAPSQTIHGRALAIYVPGHGRYVFSLHVSETSRPENDGEVAGNSLTFNAPDGNVFRIESAERIAPGSGTYTLHVSPDTGWTPADAQDRAWVMIEVSTLPVPTAGR